MWHHRWCLWPGRLGAVTRAAGLATFAPDAIRDREPGSALGALGLEERARRRRRGRRTVDTAVGVEDEEPATGGLRVPEGTGLEAGRGAKLHLLHIDLSIMLRGGTSYSIASTPAGSDNLAFLRGAPGKSRNQEQRKPGLVDPRSWRPQQTKGKRSRARPGTPTGHTYEALPVGHDRPLQLI